MTDLTDKQKRFVDEYLVDLCAADAAIRAGYSPNSAKQIAYELMGHEHIARAIAARKAERSHRTEITADRVLQELAHVGFARTTNAMRWSGTSVELIPSEELADETVAAVASVEQTKDGIKVRMHNKVAALHEMGRHLGVAQKHEHSGPNGGPIQHEHKSELEIARRVAFLLESGARALIEKDKPNA